MLIRFELVCSFLCLYYFLALFHPIYFILFLLGNLVGVMEFYNPASGALQDFFHCACLRLAHQNGSYPYLTTIPQSVESPEGPKNSEAREDF